MAEKQNTPEIRFEGFTDPWEQRKLGELMDVTSVRRVHQEDWTDEGVRFLRARDLVAFARNEPIDDPLFISEEMYQEYSAQSGKVSVGDLLVTGVGTIGVPWLVTSENPIYFKDGNIIWFKNAGEIDGEFFFHSFIAGAIQSYINEAAGIGTVGTYTIDAGKKTPIWLPAKQEQRCVAALMTRLDSLITLHQRKHDKLCTVKRSMLDKMFPKPGETEPEIRFKGFTDPWEQRKLGELCTISKGHGYSKADIRDVGTPLILYGRLYTQYESRIENVDTFAVEQEESLLSKGNEVIVPASGETAEDIAVASSVRRSGIIFGGDLNVVTPVSKLDPDYIALAITYSKAHDDLAKRAQGKSVVHVHGNDIAEVEIPYPSESEQKRISTVVLGLDSLITLHQRMGPIFCFCAHGSRANFASTLQG